jgi:O-antigen ligase
MSSSRLFTIIGFYLSIQQLLGLSGNPYFNVGLQLLFFFTTYIITIHHNKQTIYFYVFPSKLSSFFNLYITLVLLSGSYFFNGDLIKWFIGILPFVYSILIMHNMYSKFKLDNIRNFKNLWKGIVYGSIIVLLVALVFGKFEDNRLSFLNITASSIGRNGIFVVAYFMSRIIISTKNKAKYYVPWILFGLIMILLAGSKSSLFSFVLIGLYLLVRLKLINLKSVVPFVLIVGILMATTVLDVYFVSFQDYIQAGHLENLTGRTSIWIPLLELIQERIWFGYGYNSPSALLTPSYFDIWNGRAILQAHNAWLQSLLNVGIFGTIPLLLIYITLFQKIAKIRELDSQIHFLLFFLAAFLLLRGFTEASFANGGGIEVYWFSIIIIQTIILTEKPKKTCYL